MTDKFTSEELAEALRMSLRQEGRYSDADAAAKICKEESVTITKTGATEALALLMKADLTKEAYQTIRKSANKKGATNLYPPYSKVLEAKRDCSVTIYNTEDGCKVNVQELFDQTMQKIWIHHVPKEKKMSVKAGQTLQAIYKAGCDGTNGVPVFQQKPTEDKTKKISTTQEMYVVGMVPLKLFIVETGETLWINQRPDSTLMTRILEFSYEKETEEKNRTTVKMLKELNSTLLPTTLSTLEERNGGDTSLEDLEDLVGDLAISDCNTITCQHKLFITMVDGKVKLHCSEKTSSTRDCAICGAGPKQMNLSAKEVTEIAADVDEETLAMGISNMHSWIKAMEFILHAAQTQPIGYKYNARKSEEEKNQVKAKKLEIQRKLRTKFGIIVDCPKQGGSGNSNSGNTARVFFREKEEVSKLLGDETFIFPLEILGRLHTLLMCCSSKDEVDPEKLERFCCETHDVLRSLVGWGIPPGIHTILFHSSQLLRLVPMPLGYWSEEAQEAINKQVKKFLRRHVRTDTEEHTNRDLMMRLLNVSDPELVLFFNENEHQHQTPTTEVQALLK